MTIAPAVIPGDHTAFLRAALTATATSTLRKLLEKLPIVEDGSYVFNERNSAQGWRGGSFHWVPVGNDLGNQGRIKLAGEPENPIAERTINAMEALIELERRRELLRDPKATAPENPREAVQRYFDLPPLEELPRRVEPIRGLKPTKYSGQLADRIRVRLVREPRPVEYAIMIEDDGVGQPPSRIHDTLLSLGRSDKGDKPYLIGVFGQGGSSAYAASELSWISSRRVSDFGDDEGGALGWTVVRRVIRPGRSQVHWAYLAAHPDGRVPSFSAAAANACEYPHGTRIAHLNYNFGKTEPTRSLYQTLNHLLFKPVLPYGLYTRSGKDAGKRDLMQGNAYRLSKLTVAQKDLDKPFASLVVEPREEKR